MMDRAGIVAVMKSLANSIYRVIVYVHISALYIFIYTYFLMAYIPF